MGDQASGAGESAGPRFDPIGPCGPDEADPAEPARPALGGSFALSCSDAPSAWLLSDGAVPGTVAAAPVPAGDGAPAIVATASDLLLWLYGRAEVDSSAVDPDLLERFRALRFTD